MPSCVGIIDDDTELQAELFIAIGCRVKLTNNTWVDGGLANGCLGTVCAVIYNENKTSPNRLIISWSNPNTTTVQVESRISVKFASISIG